jgi:hypothetical protein
MPKNGVRERHDARVAEQQVVARHQQHEHGHLRRDFERAGAGKEERGGRETDQDRDQHARQHAAAREVAGNKPQEHR